MIQLHETNHLCHLSGKLKREDRVLIEDVYLLVSEIIDRSEKEREKEIRQRRRLKEDLCPRRKENLFVDLFC